MQPLSHKFIEWVPLPPWVTGVLIAAVGLSGFMIFAVNIGLYEAVVTGQLPSIALRSYQTLMVLFGYLTAAHVYLRRWTRQHHQDLNLTFGIDKQFVPAPVWQMRTAGVVGLVAFYLLFLVLGNDKPVYRMPSLWDAEFYFALLVVPGTGWVLGRLSFDLVHCALQISRVAAVLPEINLLSQDDYRPFTQQGLRSALIMILMVSITANLIFDSETAILGSAVNIASSLIIATLSLYFPLRGIHLRISLAKASLLTKIRTQLNQQKGVLLGQAPAGTQVSELIALENRIQQVSEWPFDAGSMGKIGFYLVVGLGSWVGAALVERALEAGL